MSTTQIRRTNGAGQKPNGRPARQRGAHSADEGVEGGLHNSKAERLKSGKLKSESGFVLLGRWVRIKEGLLYGGRFGQVVNQRDGCTWVAVAGNRDRDGAQQLTFYTVDELQDVPQLPTTPEFELGQRILRLRSRLYDMSRGTASLAVWARCERLEWELDGMRRDSGASNTVMIVRPRAVRARKRRAA